MAVSYHRCTCRLRQGPGNAISFSSSSASSEPVCSTYSMPSDPFSLGSRSEMQKLPDSNSSEIYDFAEGECGSRCFGSSGGVGSSNNGSVFHRRSGGAFQTSRTSRHYNNRNVLQSNSTKVEDEDSQDSQTLQPWYFHAIASFILVVHGLTFLVPNDAYWLSAVSGASLQAALNAKSGRHYSSSAVAELNSSRTAAAIAAVDTDMVRIIARWFGYEMEWVKPFTPYAQGLASVFNISLGIVSWWTPKSSSRYNKLVQMRVFVFCLNILHAYVTGPIIYQNEDLPLLAPGRIIGLFRLSYLTPGLMAAGVTEVFVDKEEVKDDVSGLAPPAGQQPNLTSPNGQRYKSRQEMRHQAGSSASRHHTSSLSSASTLPAGGQAVVGSGN